MELLERQGITSFFPVQCQVIPHLLGSNNQPILSTYNGDLCVSAPTGSGKTLSYAIPIVEVRQFRKI